MNTPEAPSNPKKSNDVWILEYHPLSEPAPVFLLWYTDTDKESTDKLFTAKTGEIFATHSLNDLKHTIVRNLSILNQFDNLSNWLNDPEDRAHLEVMSYNMSKLHKAIANRQFDIEVLEELTNFINLFGDFVYQDEANIHLKPFTDNKYIRKAWDYFYNYIFWPRLNDKNRFETWDRPPFNVNVVKLTNGLEELIRQFEQKIVIIK